MKNTKQLEQSMVEWTKGLSDGKPVMCVLMLDNSNKANLTVFINKISTAAVIGTLESVKLDLINKIK